MTKDTPPTANSRDSVGPPDSFKQSKGNVKEFIVKHRPTPLQCFLTIFPILSGLASVTNAGCTANLSDLLGSIYWAAFFSNLVALGLSGVMYFRGPSIINGLRNIVITAKREPLTIVAHLGGLLGAVFVVLYTAVPPITGFGMFFVCAVCGQIIGALVLDRFGILWRQKVLIVWYGFLGGVLVIVGTLVFQVEQIIDSSSSKGGYAALGVVAGLAFVLQTSCNVKCGEILGGPWRGSFATFLTGAVVLLVPAFIDKTNPRFNTFTGSNWWPLLSGVLSTYSVTVAIILPQYIGFSATFCWAIFGQLTASLVFDSCGWLGSDVTPVSASRICGVIAVLGGVILVQIGGDFSAAIESEQRAKAGQIELVAHAEIDSYNHQEEEEEEGVSLPV